MNVFHLSACFFRTVLEPLDLETSSHMNLPGRAEVLKGFFFFKGRQI